MRVAGLSFESGIELGTWLDDAKRSGDISRTLVEELVRHPNYEVRSIAWRVLEGPCPSCLDALQSYAEDVDAYGFGLELTLALATYGPIAEDALIRVLRSVNPEVVPLAAAALGHVGSEKGLRALQSVKHKTLQIDRAIEQIEVRLVSEQPALPWFLTSCLEVSEQLTALLNAELHWAVVYPGPILQHFAGEVLHMAIVAPFSDSVTGLTTVDVRLLVLSREVYGALHDDDSAWTRFGMVEARLHELATGSKSKGWTVSQTSRDEVRVTYKEILDTFESVGLAFLDDIRDAEAVVRVMTTTPFTGLKRGAHLEYAAAWKAKRATE